MQLIECEEFLIVRNRWENVVEVHFSSLANGCHCWPVPSVGGLVQQCIAFDGSLAYRQLTTRQGQQNNPCLWRTLQAARRTPSNGGCLRSCLLTSSALAVR